LPADLGDLGAAEADAQMAFGRVRQGEVEDLVRRFAATADAARRGDSGRREAGATSSTQSTPRSLSSSDRSRLPCACSPGRSRSATSLPMRAVCAPMRAA
jgi:hypothetical protein